MSPRWSGNPLPHRPPCPPSMPPSSSGLLEQVDAKLAAHTVRLTAANQLPVAPNHGAHSPDSTVLASISDTSPTPGSTRERHRSPSPEAAVTSDDSEGTSSGIDLHGRTRRRLLHQRAPAAGQGTTLSWSKIYVTCLAQPTGPYV